MLGFSLFGQSLNKSLIESTILINVDSLRKESNQILLGRRVLDDQQELTLEGKLAPLESMIIPVDDLIADMEDAFKTFQNPGDEQAEEAFSHAIEYLAENKIRFALTDNQMVSAIKSIAIAFSNTFPDDDKIANMPRLVFQSISPDRIASWNSSASYWVGLISQSLVESVPTENYPLISGSILKSVLELIQNEDSNPSIGFYAGIEPVENFETPNEVMKFDGSMEKFFKFDPIKTELIKSAVLSISSSVFSTTSGLLKIENGALLDEDLINQSINDLSEVIIKDVFSFLSNLDGNHAIFTYEISKVISNSLVMGSVASAINEEDLSSSEYPTKIAKSASEKIAFHIIDQALELGMEEQWDLKRLAEATSFGSSVGAQMASIFEKSMDYPPNWQKYERNQLAKATAEGSSEGSTDARISTWNEISQNLPEEEDIREEAAENARQDLLSISQHSSMGSLIGNVGISIYYPNPLDRLALINYAAQGAATGSMVGVSKYNLKGNDTESFDVQIARSSSNGAAFGATFETIALTNANPKDFSSDNTTISVVEAVTYGSTYGAITAGNDPSVGANAADALIFKQAVKQGSIEGSLNGSSLGTGSAEESFNTDELRSSSSIVKAAANTNAQAAADASSSMATKAIRTSTSDMLLLMKKFNINPRLTNPTKIFNKKTSSNEEADFLFEKKLQVASPI